VPRVVGSLLRESDSSDAFTAGGASGYTVYIRGGNSTETDTSGEIVVLAAASVDQAIGLPSAVGNTAKYHIKKTGNSGLVTIDASGSETIEGQLSVVLGDPGEAITVVSDDANWWII
jgi:hypothetical protein